MGVAHRVRVRTVAVAALECTIAHGLGPRLFSLTLNVLVGGPYAFQTERFERVLNDQIALLINLFPLFRCEHLFLLTILPGGLLNASSQRSDAGDQCS